MAEATIERVQERWDRQRYNIRHGRITVGSREYFDELAGAAARLAQDNRGSVSRP